MRRADIVANGRYRAQVGWHVSAEVTVLETGVPYTVGVRRRPGGVRVRLEEAVNGLRLDVGEEFVIASRDVLRPWSEEDTAAREEARREEARKEEIGRRLGEAGYREVLWGSSDGACFRWRGEMLELSPQLADELLERAGLL